MIDHNERDHALLSASGAEKWINCPPSARLEDNYPDTSSEYAAEGTLAHEIAELKARKQFIEGIGSKKFASELKKLKDHPLYQKEMEGYTDGYIDYLKESSMRYPAPPYISIEKKIDYSAYAPEGFGTCDAIMIYGSHMRVIDLKYGKGVPKSAENNPQLMLYALGAYEASRMLFPIETITLCIYQPRLDNVSEWEISVTDLLTWAKDTVLAVSELAYQGKGDFKPGEHCRFCKAQAQCKAKAEDLIQVFEPIKKDPGLLSDEEIGVVLVKAKELVAWCNSVEKYAMESILSGKPIAGWKAVEGRSTRAFTDADAAFAALIAAGTPEEMLYERRMLTLAQAEKVTDKEIFKTAAGPYIIKTPGKPTLAPEGGKRPSIIKSANDVFTIKKENDENE